jgi:hypothetical protein
MAGAATRGTGRGRRGHPGTGRGSRSHLRGPAGVGAATLEGPAGACALSGHQAGDRVAQRGEAAGGGGPGVGE